MINYRGLCFLFSFLMWLWTPK